MRTEGGCRRAQRGTRNKAWHRSTGAATLVVTLAAVVVLGGASTGVERANMRAHGAEIDRAAEIAVGHKERLIAAAEDAMDLVDREAEECEGRADAVELRLLADEASETGRIGIVPAEFAEGEVAAQAAVVWNIELGNRLSNRAEALRERTCALAESIARSNALEASREPQERVDEAAPSEAIAPEAGDGVRASRDLPEKASDRSPLPDDSEPGASASIEGDVWHVRYRDGSGTDAAASDGSVTRWKPGYFIAHAWSAEGRRIASMPPCVVVDGVRYKLDGHRLVSKDATWRQVADWATSGGRISFQTCSGNSNLIVRYAPSD